MKTEGANAIMSGRLLYSMYYKPVELSFLMLWSVLIKIKWVPHIWCISGQLNWNIYFFHI